MENFVTFLANYSNSHTEKAICESSYLTIKNIISNRLGMNCVIGIWINRTKKKIFGDFMLNAIIALTFLVLIGLSNAYGIGFYSKDDKPSGLSLDDWISKWWAWDIALNTDQATPKPDGCLINKSDSMVMLMNPALVGKPPHQVCMISSDQGIIVPLWLAFQEDSTPEFDNYTYDQLYKLQENCMIFGAVTSLVKVDGKPIAKLDVVSSMRGGTLDYKINSIDNVTELYSKGFNITIPENTNLPDQNTGTWRSGCSWMVRLPETVTTRRSYFVLQRRGYWNRS